MTEYLMVWVYITITLVGNPIERQMNFHNRYPSKEACEAKARQAEARFVPGLIVTKQGDHLLYSRWVCVPIPPKS